MAYRHGQGLFVVPVVAVPDALVVELVLVLAARVDSGQKSAAAHNENSRLLLGLGDARMTIKARPKFETTFCKYL